MEKTHECDENHADLQMGGEVHPHEEPLSTGTGDSYLGSGAKDSHHGYTFQFNLLMLYATRALNLGYKDFRLATEMVHAEKFDDVIFCIPKKGNSGKWSYQFIQAKHTLRKKKAEIKASQLFDKSGGPFSLIKYFESYRNMKRNSELLNFGDEIRSLVICSNIGFNFGQSFGHFTFDESIFTSSAKDEILSNELLRFKEDFCGRREVVLYLKNSCISLPRDFSVSVTKGKKFFLKSHVGKCESSSLYDCYRVVLIKEVVDTDLRIFRKDFVEGRGLSSAASHFRDVLWFKFLDEHSELQDEDAFKSFLTRAVVEICGELTKMPDTTLTSHKTLAKLLAESIFKNRDGKKVSIKDDFPVLQKNMDMLLDFVLVKKGELVVFSPGFLEGKWLPESLGNLRESLKARMRNLGINLGDLVDYSFEVGSIGDISTRYCGERLEQDVREFMEILSFAVNQPDTAEMESLVKAEVAKFLNVSNALNAYGRFFNDMYSWAERKDARYLTGDDVKRFFQERKKEMTGGIRFNVRISVPDFVGRNQQLMKIHEVLQSRMDERCLQVPRAVVVCGLGGMGKSELARKYALKHYSINYDNIIWLNSENNERIENCLKMLAYGRLGILKEDRNGDIKDLEVIVQETYDFFKGKRTLIVFDNVELSENLSKFFPRFFSGDDDIYVLMTARTHEWKGFHVIDLDNFSPDEAYEFIHLSLYGIPNWNDGDARELAKTLSNFPLALKQAVSFIEDKGRHGAKSGGKEYGIPDYLELLRESSKYLLDCPFRKELLNSYGETAFSTMSIALKHLKSSKNGQMAIPLLNVLTYLSPDTIDVDILRTAYPRYTTYEVDASMNVLRKLSIIKVDGRLGIIHHLIQYVNKIILKNTGKEKEALYEAMRLAEVMEVEHQMSVWESLSGHKLLVKNFCRIPDRIAEQLSKKLMHGVALEFIEKAVKVLSQHIGPDDYETLLCKRSIGRIHYFSGKFKEAAKIQKLVLNDHERVLGKNDPDTFVAMYHYGVSIMHLGENEEALRIFKTIVEQGSWPIGKEPSIVLSSKKNISLLLEILGKEEGKVEEYCGELYAWAKGVLRKYNGGKSCSNELASNSPGGKGDQHSAKTMEYLQLRRKTYGSESPVNSDELLSARVILADVCQKERKYDEAYEHCKAGIKVLQGDHSDDHLKVMTLRLKMCDALLGMEKHDEALGELRKYTYEKTSCSGESFQCKHLFFTGCALWGKQEYGESVKCFINCYKYGVGEEELITKVNSIMVDNMKMLLLEGQYEVPIQFLQLLYDVIQRDVNACPRIMTVLEFFNAISPLIYSNGHEKQALEVVKYVYQCYKIALGETSTRTLKMKFIFSKYYCEIGVSKASKKGKVYMLEVLKALCAQLDREDETVFNLFVELLSTLKGYIDEESFLKIITDTKRKVVKCLGKNHSFYHRLQGVL